MDAWIIDRINRERQERKNRESWERRTGLKMPIHKPKRPERKDDAPYRGCEIVDYGV